MAEYAPTAIKGLYALVELKMPRATLSGILGDQAHTWGYHRCRNVLPSDDYSRTLSADKLGDGWAASALDISLPPDLMIVVTKRLLAAAKAKDPRLAAVREFCGTTNGTVTHNYDLSTGHEGLGEWDDSHLWHVHLSILRKYANDAPALAPIADVIAGIPLTTDPLEEAMAFYKDKADFEKSVREIVADEVHAQAIRLSLLPGEDPKTAKSGHTIYAGVARALKDHDSTVKP